MTFTKNLVYSLILIFCSICYPITIVAVGDLVVGDTFSLDSATSSYIHGDVVFGNLEGCISDSMGTPKQCGHCFRFKSPTKVAPAISKYFDILNVANNHINDYGPLCRDHTLQTLLSNGMCGIGLEESPTATIMVDSLIIGFIGFAPNRGSLDFREIPRAISLIKLLKQSCNIVVVSFHGGAEGEKYQHITRKNEYYFGENRGNPYLFAHTLINAGADLIIGHGPHVTRAVEVYKDRLIMYSLGNFYTNGAIKKTGKCGVAPLAHIALKPDGAFDSLTVISIRQPNTIIDSTNEAYNTLILLSKQDRFTSIKIGPR